MVDFNCTQLFHCFNSNFLDIIGYYLICFNLVEEYFIAIDLCHVKIHLFIHGPPIK